MSRTICADLCLIWAQSPSGAIGFEGDIPWHSKKDFQHFRSLTMGCPVIMGRKTWDSLPRKPLPGRVNIVVSHSVAELEGASVVRSLEEALALANEEALDRVFVIGGATLYAQALPQAQRVYKTLVDVEVPQADAFAPTLGEDWVLVKERKEKDEGLSLTFSEHARLTS